MMIIIIVSARQWANVRYMQQPGIPRVRAIKRDASAAPVDSAVSMIVHGTFMYLNLTFMN